MRPINNDWEYLILKRIPAGGGFWQAVTGGVEDNEEYYQSAVRELREETGFAPDKIEPVDYSYTFPVDPQMRKLYDQPVETITEVVFLARIKPGIDPTLDPIEHDDWKWCDFDEAVRTVYWPGNKESLSACRRHLRRDDHRSP